MTTSKLRTKLRRQARREYRRGNITNVQLQACEEVAGNVELLIELNETIERDVNPWNRTDGLVGMDWQEWLANLWDWFVANWPAILEVIMTIVNIAPMFTDEEDEIV